MDQSTIKPIMSVKNLSKSFSGKTVVDGVSFEVYPGEIIALVGENGAGKSTTKNMLCGLLQASEGEIYIDGQLVERIHGHKNGISAVHQELSLFKSLTVAANMCISDLPGSPMFVNWKEADRIAKEQLEFLGIEIDTKATIESLGAGKQQVVEIAKALLHADRLLILDEPTTSLTAPEREKLFGIMEKLKNKGVSIIFISHFMDEIFKVSDKYIVLRDGKQVGEGRIEDISRSELEGLMVGRAIAESHIDIGKPTEVEGIRVEGLSSYDFYNVSFEVKKGEILGIAGLMGAGRTELAEGIFGIRPMTGKVFVKGSQVAPITVEGMKKHNVCYITEDRRSNGIFPTRSVRENITAAGIEGFIKRKVKGFGFKGESENAQQVVDEMNVSLPHIESRITSLSGGNQQKVLLGRWLATNPEVIILDEPTKGVDIGAKFDIHNQIATLAKEGATVILVSSDLPELLDLSHRLLVMRSGHMVGSFDRHEYEPTKIIALAASSAYEQHS